jgi:hypothetical protein
MLRQLAAILGTQGAISSQWAVRGAHDWGRGLSPNSSVEVGVPGPLLLAIKS